MNFICRSFLVLLFAIWMFSSCASRTRVVYVQDIDGKEATALANYEPKLKPDDVISVLVSAENPELVSTFNMTDVGIISGGGADNQNRNQRTYILDAEGRINFPLLGFVKVGGLTKRELVNELTRRIGEYVENPVVNVRLLNFKVSVLGEVKIPGQINVTGDRISILDALAAAGDLTIQGRRDNILLIREEDGKKTYGRIDLTNSNFIDSPYYYLGQNDVIYVEPNQTKINSSVIGNDITTLISLTSLAITITSFILLRM